ncbi:hypothetical protein P3T36_005431 [Kitasatospora sp. MAP12-15]|uniref:hypothetical protein n=1 Tax=unclassified Kitasatospora TaxID=2633591 RepID=UPI002473872B|nr:hypothetical protein [Kitasatospora sp. MAP12-44]MDH6109768.1 hypothetical protein [Kitasatospora sp. MAP12-44]
MLLRERIPVGGSARVWWGELPRKERLRVISEARHSRAYDDQRVAAIAVGWAWQVLGPPETRRKPSLERLLFILDVLTTTAGSTTGVDIFDGSATWDSNPYVRSRAKRIESANPVTDKSTVT